MSRSSPPVLIYLILALGWVGLVAWRECSERREAAAALARAAVMAELGAPGPAYDEPLARQLAESFGFQRFSFVNLQGVVYAEAVLPRKTALLTREIELETVLRGPRPGMIRALRLNDASYGDLAWLWGFAAFALFLSRCGLDLHKGLPET